MRTFADVSVFMDVMPCAVRRPESVRQPQNSRWVDAIQEVSFSMDPNSRSGTSVSGQLNLLVSIATLVPAVAILGLGFYSIGRVTQSSGELRRAVGRCSQKVTGPSRRAP